MREVFNGKRKRACRCRRIQHRQQYQLTEVNLSGVFHNLVVWNLTFRVRLSVVVRFSFGSHDAFVDDLNGEESENQRRGEAKEACLFDSARIMRLRTGLIGTELSFILTTKILFHHAFKAERSRELSHEFWKSRLSLSSRDQ